MNKYLKRVADWFKLTFWDRVYLRFDHANADRVLVSVRPRLLARIFNQIDESDAWMERHVNSNGFVSWVGKIKIDGVTGLLLIHSGFLLNSRIERAWASNRQVDKYLPDARATAHTSSLEEDSDDFN